MIWYSVILIFGIVGLISIVMFYDEMKRSALILAALSILPSIGLFIKLGVSRKSMGEAIPSFVTENLHLFIMGGMFVAVSAFFVEGGFHWIWRRVHPQSAPTAEIGAGQRGHVTRQGPAMSPALMGTSTEMFSVAGLDVKTTALIRLSLFAFNSRNSKTVIGIESHLRLGNGRRYKAFHSIVAEVQHRRVSLTDIVHPYRRAINENHSSARLMFADLCKIAVSTGNTDKKTVNRLLKIGQALGLSPQDMGQAIGKM